MKSLNDQFVNDQLVDKSYEHHESDVDANGPRKVKVIACLIATLVKLIVLCNLILIAELQVKELFENVLFKILFRYEINLCYSKHQVIKLFVELRHLEVKKDNRVANELN